MGSFAPALDELRRRVDKRLMTYLAQVRTRIPRSGVLVAEVEELLKAGGKRLRPAFCYWGFRAGGGDDRAEILRAAASLELLHSFALVHDDIMDLSPERRGRPTVFARHGVDTALLVGDLAMVLADEMLMSSGFDGAVLQRALEPYSRMRREVIVGQFAELELSRQVEVDEEEARNVARMKSGRYSVREPLLIGVALSGAEETHELIDFGDCVGEAFQIRDDLLGTFGSEAETGKPADSDIRRGKRNVLFAFTLTRLSSEERDFFLRCWGGGDSLSDDVVRRLRALVSSSGAADHAERVVQDLLVRARAALDGVSLEPAARAALWELAGLATLRDA